MMKFDRLTGFFLCYINVQDSGRECKNDGECVLNAYCHEGKLCLCRDGFIAIVTSKKNFTCVNGIFSVTYSFTLNFPMLRLTIICHMV